MSTNIIDIKDVSYQSDRSILEDVSFRIDKGGKYYILGENGSGKSTLLNLILKDIDPTKGSIITNYSKKTLGVVYNDVKFFPLLTVEELIKYFSVLCEVDFKEVKQRLVPILSIDGILKSKIKVLSSGEQQKLNILFALMKKPELLILDEPFSNIDPIKLKSIVKLIDDTSETVIVCTHNWDLIEEEATVVFLHEGKLLATDTSKNLLKRYPATKIITSVPVAQDNVMQYQKDNNSIFFFNDKDEALDFVRGNELTNFTIEVTDLKDVYEILKSKTL